MDGKAALCLLPAAPRALGHAQPQVPPHKPARRFSAQSGDNQTHRSHSKRIFLPFRSCRTLQFVAPGQPCTRATWTESGPSVGKGKTLDAIAEPILRSGRSSTTIRENSRHSYRAGRSATTTQLRKTDTLAAGSEPSGCRGHWCRPCAQFWSRFCSCVRIGAWACADQCPRQPAPCEDDSQQGTAY